MYLWGVAVFEPDTATTRDQTMHLALVQRLISYIKDPSLAT